MNINFYLTTQSFDRTNYQSLFRSLMGMYRDVCLVEEYKDENSFYVCSDVFTVVVDGGMRLFEICTSTAIPKDVRDAINLLIPALTHSSEQFKFCSENSSNVISNTSGNNAQDCVAIMADENAPLVNKDFGPVYSKQTCLHLRHKYWVKYINDTDHYLRQCRKYYHHLYFHSEVDNNIGTIYDTCKRQITESLTTLDEEYYPMYVSYGDNKPSEDDQMKQLGAKCSLDSCTQGSEKKKLDATFTFLDDKGANEKLFCGLHIKYNYDDQGKNFSNERRLYFHEPHPEVQKGEKVLVAHIGGHLPQKGFKK